MEAWKPCDLILTSRLKVRDRGPEAAVRALPGVFPGNLGAPPLSSGRHKAAEHHGHHPRALTGGRPNQQEVVLNDVVEVPLKYAREVLGGMWGSNWALGYAITVHSSQCLTTADPQKVWIIDDYLHRSNLAYLAVSRVEHLSQLQRVVCPPEEGSEGAGTLTEQQLRKVIQRKLVAYKRQDATKGLRFNLKVDNILELKKA